MKLLLQLDRTVTTNHENTGDDTRRDDRKRNPRDRATLHFSLILSEHGYMICEDYFITSMWNENPIQTLGYLKYLNVCVHEFFYTKMQPQPS